MTLQKVMTRYHLVRAPFEKDIAPEDFFWTEGLESARMRLKAAVEGRSSAVLTGDSGSGKTCVIRALEHELPPGNYNVHYLANSMVNHRDFYRQISVALGLEVRATAAALFHQVSETFRRGATEHQSRSILVLDEAHLLPPAVLGHLHILLNFERDSKPWLTLVLVGLPELRARLTREALKSLAARLPTRIALRTLDAAGVREYVSHRLGKAGARSQIFSEDAILLLAEASTGVMRRLDVLAAESLAQGLADKGTVVDATAVERAVRICEDILR